VGANHGQFGNLLRAIGYSGWIVSFEPVRGPFEDLSKCAAAQPPWRVYQFALGSKDGEQEINVNEDDQLTSFLSPLGPSKTLPCNRVASRQAVEIRRLDSIFGECTAGANARNFYLKLDTQGFDIEVLRGAEGILPKILGAQTEVSFVPIYRGMPGYIESLTAFESKGFNVVDFMPVTRVAGDIVVLEMDCILARSVELIANS
jgi:FkbM family methyltransferase